MLCNIMSVHANLLLFPFHTVLFILFIFAIGFVFCNILSFDCWDKQISLFVVSLHSADNIINHLMSHSVVCHGLVLVKLKSINNY